MRKVRGGLAALACVGVLLSCGGGSGLHTYDNNDLQLISGYTAKELCSCLFVMQMDEPWCRAWVKNSPAVADARVDTEAKTVQAGALFLWGARARYVDEDFGCVLQ